MNLADALSARDKLNGIRWVLSSAPSRGALRDQLKALLSAPNLLGPCRLRRARFKPGRKLSAHYHALVHTLGTEGYGARPMAVTWRLDGDADQRHGEDDLAEMQAAAHRHGVAAPFRQLVTDVPEWGMHIQVSPLDAWFPQLVRLSDPGYVRAMLAGACSAAGIAPEKPRPGRYTVTSIRYHPGKRHVLRYDPVDEAKGGTVFAKLYTGENGARAFHVATQVAGWLAEHGEGATAVRPLAYVGEDRVVLYPRVFGAPLCEHMQGPMGVSQCLERAGAALNALHRLPQALAGPLQTHDFEAEVKKAAGASDHIPALLPSLGALIDKLLDRARELHERLPQEPPAFTHGDFKSEHLWTGSGQVTLIDFDTCRLADPAFDVGRLLADLQLRHIISDQPGLDQVQGKFLAGYAPGAPEGRLIRARLYEAVQLVKIARRVPVSECNWASCTEQVIGRAQALINDLERIHLVGKAKYRTQVLRIQCLFEEGSQI